LGKKARKRRGIKEDKESRKWGLGSQGQSFGRILPPEIRKARIKTVETRLPSRRLFEKSERQSMGGEMGDPSSQERQFLEGVQKVSVDNLIENHTILE